MCTGERISKSYTYTGHWECCLVLVWINASALIETPKESIESSPSFKQHRVESSIKSSHPGNTVWWTFHNRYTACTLSESLCLWGVYYMYVDDDDGSRLPTVSLASFTPLQTKTSIQLGKTNKESSYSTSILMSPHAAQHSWFQPVLLQMV